MELVTSPQFEKSMRRLDPQLRELVYRKLELFLQNKGHPSLRYKTVPALKHLQPPVREISIHHEHSHHFAGIPGSYLPA